MIPSDTDETGSHDDRLPSWRQPERIRVWGIVSWSFLGVLLLALASLWLLGTLSGFIVPALIGTVLAIALNPLVGLLLRGHIPRSIGSLLVALGALGVIGIIAWSILTVLVDKAPEFIDAFYDGLVELATATGSSSAGEWAAESAKQAESEIQDFLITGVLPLVGEGVMAGAGLVFSVFTMFLFAYFLMWDGPLVRRWVEKLSGLSPDAAHELTGTMISTTRRYLLGMTIVALINAVIGAVFSIAAGVELWLGIAVILFLGTYVPYLGGVVSGVVAVLVAIGLGGLDAGLIVFVGVLLINLLVQPNVQTFAVGATLRLRPLAVFSLAMLGILIGGAIGGAAAAPLARLVMDGRVIVRDDRKTNADESSDAVGASDAQST